MRPTVAPRLMHPLPMPWKITLRRHNGKTSRTSKRRSRQRLPLLLRGAACRSLLQAPLPPARWCVSGRATIAARTAKACAQCARRPCHAPLILSHGVLPSLRRQSEAGAPVAASAVRCRCSPLQIVLPSTKARQHRLRRPSCPCHLMSPFSPSAPTEPRNGRLRRRRPDGVHHRAGTRLLRVL